MDTSKQPGINFDGIFLKELKFDRTPNINDINIDIKFNAKSMLSEDQKRLIYELGCSVVDKNNAFNLICTLVGIFSSIQGSENMDLIQFANTNAPALMIPYIRELVASTTTRAGLAPVVFPPINIIAILENNKAAQKTQ
jgi:preprotein translocase subunit SecB